jgi:hypothetical protein
MRIPRTRFAIIPESTVLDWAIPVCVLWGIRSEQGFAMIDRRRLAREIRIECQSIAADIAALERQTRRGAA